MTKLLTTSSVALEHAGSAFVGATGVHKVAEGPKGDRRPIRRWFQQEENITQADHTGLANNVLSPWEAGFSATLRGNPKTVIWQAGMNCGAEDDLTRLVWVALI
eukprot:CAMPEP_0206431590 /NCGR_PEP_ID=MMETSP0324_2-20121206/7450_1 /ASSEMBLY_ACC=CAM_ASM_000836 /TAXON_ID=2866 /ORGANISM="Crypthecodinium cohnii, Strain Seligo" /LENGTH=103 /DNA_ID=CAMNT_0053897537 /DNA_START=348 /DNA_END=660 /DNA_ORIENTATION=+